MSSRLTWGSDRVIWDWILLASSFSLASWSFLRMLVRSALDILMLCPLDPVVLLLALGGEGSLASFFLPSMCFERRDSSSLGAFFLRRK